MKTAIIGSTGYGGVELIRLLQQHPELELTMLISTSQAGVCLHHVYPHLAHLAYAYEDFDLDQVTQQVDLLFFATPPGISSKWTPFLIEQGKIVIDLSGDFRLKQPDLYKKWYGIPSAPESLLQKAVYGLSEWYSKDIQTASLISNPGCYPTATLLALLPLLQENILDPSSIIIDAKSGVTGAGRSLNQKMLYGEVNENLRPYKVDGHQHIPEIEQFASIFAQKEITVSFIPHLIPMNRGILVSIYGSYMHKYTNKQLYELYQDVYRSSPFIRIQQEAWPETKAVQGSNYCDIGFHVDERTGRIVVLAAIDNLMKGAAGQAVQNANLRIGCLEETGLLYSPLYP